MHVGGCLNGVICQALLLSALTDDDRTDKLDASHEMRRDVYDQLVQVLCVPTCAWPHFKLVAKRFK